MANKVDTHHPCYDPLHLKRDVFHAVKGGTDAIRAKGEIYLPKYPAEETKEYKERLAQATLDGIVSGGCDTLSGAVFYGDIDTEGVHSSIQPLLENIDNKGNHFNVFARQAFDAAFDGSAVILVDTPNVAQPVNSLEDEQVLGIRPYWRLYFADDVINWRYRVNPMSMEEELEFIVFHEPKEEIDPMNYFAVKMVDHYRVYYFDGMSVRWELWRKTDKPLNAEEQFILVDGGTMANRSAIPVAIVGALEDEPRLLVESRLEVKAYQKESSFDVIEYLSIPTFFTKGWEPKSETDRLALGASTHVQLPLEGEVGYAQIDSAGHVSLKETIKQIKDYCKTKLNELTTAAMGGQEKTATQVNVEDRDKQARLIVWAEQFKDALELALGFTAEAMGMGIDEGGEIVLQTKWEVQKQEAEENKVRQAELEQANIAATAAKAAVSH